MERNDLRRIRCHAALFLIGLLLLSALLAAQVGMDNCQEVVWVAREKIVGAEPTIPLHQKSLTRGLAFGLPVFAVGAVLSVPLTALYAAVLGFFRRGR